MSTPGRRWAYVGVGLGFTASITANIASTVLKETEVSLWLRVPFAGVWPVLTYIAIEVIARTEWDSSWSHRAIRLLLAGPVGLVAAFVSYLHQHHLMVLSGEPGLAQGFGPIAIDCLLFGTAAVLILKRKEKAEDVPPTEISISQPMQPGIDWDREFQEMKEQEILPASVSAPPAESVEKEMDDSEARSVSAGVQTEREGSIIRRSVWDARQVAEMILSGAKTEEITEATGAKPASIGRFRKVARMIQADNRAVIDPKKEKVTSDNIRMIRELVVSR